jgi:hypothetical protein
MGNVLFGNSKSVDKVANPQLCVNCDNLKSKKCLDNLCGTCCDDSKCFHTKISIIDPTSSKYCGALLDNGETCVNMHSMKCLSIPKRCGKCCIIGETCMHPRYVKYIYCVNCDDRLGHRNWESCSYCEICCNIISIRDYKSCITHQIYTVKKSSHGRTIAQRRSMGAIRRKSGKTRNNYVKYIRLVPHKRIH